MTKEWNRHTEIICSAEEGRPALARGIDPPKNASDNTASGVRGQIQPERPRMEQAANQAVGRLDEQRQRAGRHSNRREAGFTEGSEGQAAQPAYLIEGAGMLDAGSGGSGV